jgi:hypothetical protein
MDENQDKTQNDKYITLDPGLLTYCQGTWDEESKTFLMDDPMNVITCCLNSCKPNVEKCYELCKQGKRKDSCLKCKEILKSCESNCYEYPSETMETVKNIVKEKGCGTYPSINKDCMENAKDEIVEECLKTCYNSEKDDCSKSCKDFYTLLYNKDIYNEKEGYGTLKTGVKSEGKPTFHDVFLITITILALIVFVYVYKFYTP